MKDVCEWCNKVFDVPFMQNINHGVYCCAGCQAADDLFCYMMSEKGQEEMFQRPAREAPKEMRKKKRA